MKLYIRLYIVFLWLGCAYFANLYQNDCKYPQIRN